MKDMLFRTMWSATTGLVVAASALHAQAGSGTITGKVTSDGGAPLPAATVTVVGLGLGAYTDDAGRYKITVPAARLTGQPLTVLARRIGSRAKTVSVTLSAGANVDQDFALADAPNQLEGQVITALGVTREKSQLGTAQQQISTEQLNTTHSPNILNQLSGKVSGVTITGGGTQGGTTNIVIRGQNSITGSNVPLFVVDGTPVVNITRGGDPNGGYDFGSIISDLNPNDIATLTVLKGPNAAALYGSRAANGVILITTKKGAASNGKIATQLSSSYTFDTPSILPTYQNLYGQGAGGQFKFVDGAGGGVQDGNDQSYGPRLDGRLIDQFTGKAQPWVAHPNNVESFFNTGRTLNTTLALSGGNERANGRLSLGTEQVTGYIPNSAWNKVTGMLNVGFQVNDRLSTSANLQYINNQGRNRPGTGYNVGILEQFIWFGRQIDMNALRAKQYDASGGLFNWNYNFHNNPFWLQDANPERDTRDNFVGSVTGTYKVADWLNARLTSGSNVFRFNSDQDFAEGNLNFADQKYAGGFNLFNSYRNENNTELLALANKQVTSRLSLSGSLGGNHRAERYNSSSQVTSGLSVPGIYNVSNAAITPTLGQFQSRRQVNSIYGGASFTFDNWWTVEGTARNDWSSTLPKNSNSYFYPSLNTSVVLTDAIPALKSNTLSYIKLRGAIAQVGNDADPYQLATVFVGNSNKFGSLPLYTLDGTIANANLKPEKTRSTEGGAELGFFDGRITLDMSVYTKETTDQIVNLRVSSTSGFTSKAINAGKIRNTGFEALASVTPLSNPRGLNWTSSFNYSQNRGKVVSLFPGLTTIVLGSSWTANIEARVNEPYGAIFGYPFLRDSASGQLLLSGGLPQQGKKSVLGNVQPRWTGGWTNDFKYKAVSLTALLDFHMGGKIFSVSNMFGNYTGVFANTIEGREVDWNKPGKVIKGIDQDTGKPNTTKVTAEDYYQSLFEIHEPFVYDDSYMKLREVRVGVDLPQRWIRRLNAQSLNVSFIGRNLWTRTDVPNIDPEFTYTTGNFQGIEFAALPNARSLGISLRLTP